MSTIRNGDAEQLYAIVQPWLYYNQGVVAKDYDFLNKIGEIMKAKGLDGYELIPGQGSDQEWMELKKDSERASSSLSKIKREGGIKKRHDFIDQKCKEIMEIAGMITPDYDQNVLIDKGIKAFEDIRSAKEARDY
jgi:hypothetical protein